MAFVKKEKVKTPATYKTAAPVSKAAANYARKKAEEVEEVEEVVEEMDEVNDEVSDEVQDEVNDEVQDDYEEETQEVPAPAPAQPRRTFTQQRQASPAPANREPGKALRLTGLFAGKREGCFSGKLRPEDATNLAALIQEAQSTNQQIVFFLWENQGNPQFSLTANISAPAQKKAWGNRGGNGGGQGNRGWGNQNRGFRRY